MPWWSLPETIRAALAAWRVAEDDRVRRECLAILAQAHNAFVTHYVRPRTHLMAVKVQGIGPGGTARFRRWRSVSCGHDCSFLRFDSLALPALR